MAIRELVIRLNRRVGESNSIPSRELLPGISPDTVTRQAPSKKASSPRPVSRPRQEISDSGLSAFACRHGERDADRPELFLSFGYLTQN
jgi:hypothetical protein